MEELMSFLQTYSEILTGAAIIVMGLLLMLFLMGILRQIKRLNKSLGSITANMQAYFDVILQEEEPAPEAPVKVQEATKSESGESEENLVEQKLTKKEQEEVLNELLKEYFSKKQDAIGRILTK